MKKFLTLVLSVLMMFTLIPMAISVSADTESEILIQDFEEMTAGTSLPTNGDDPGKIWNETNYASYTNWIALNYGNSARISGKTQNTKLPLPVGWNEKAKGNLKAVVFDCYNGKTTASASFSYVGFTASSSSENIAYKCDNNSTTIGASKVATMRFEISDTVSSNLSNSTEFTSTNPGYLAVAATNSNDNILIDNIRLVYTPFTATFSGAAEEVSSIVCDLDYNTSKTITLPNATISGGEFAGWMVDGFDTVYPAGAEVDMTGNVSYMAVGSVRNDQPAPSAPTLENKTYNSVTLCAVEGCQYSIDGTTWQNSNEFTGLTSNTEYTFYQRYKATAVAYSSPASSGITVKTYDIFNFRAKNTLTAWSSNCTVSNYDTTDVVAASYKTFSAADNSSFTFTLTGLNPGYYTMTIGSRNVKDSTRAKSRSAYTMSACDETGTVQDLGIMDFSDKTYLLPKAAYHCETPVSTQIVVTTGSTVELTYTMYEKGGSGAYIDGISLLRTADYVDTTVDCSMSMGAAMRLNEVSGIRFYTTVDQDKIADLKEQGATVEMGTLIAPLNLINGELTFADESDIYAENDNYVVVPFVDDTYYTNDSGFSGVVGSLANIKDTNANREFVGRGYVKVTLDGISTVSYATYYDNDVSNNSRTISWIATQLKNDEVEYAKLSNDNKDIVEKFVALFIAD